MNYDKISEWHDLPDEMYHFQVWYYFHQVFNRRHRRSNGFRASDERPFTDFSHLADARFHFRPVTLHTGRVIPERIRIQIDWALLWHGSRRSSLQEIFTTSILPRCSNSKPSGTSSLDDFVAVSMNSERQQGEWKASFGYIASNLRA